MTASDPWEVEGVPDRWLVVVVVVVYSGEAG